MRVFFLHNSPYKQLFYNAVIPLSPILDHGRSRTRIASVFGAQNWYLELPGSVHVAEIKEKPAENWWEYFSSIIQPIKNSSALWLCSQLDIWPMNGPAQEMHQFSVLELVFRAPRECTRSRNQGITIRKLMRVFFLHNSSHKQLFYTAVVSLSRFLRYARTCTKFGPHAAPNKQHLEICTSVQAAKIDGLKSENWWWQFSSIIQVINNYSTTQWCSH